jgi:hypothetical protein
MPTAIDRQPDKIEIREQVQTKKGYVEKMSWDSPADEAVAAILPAFDLQVNTQKLYPYVYNFTVVAAAATAGDVYEVDGFEFTVLATIAGGVALSLTGKSPVISAVGNLTLVRGSGDAVIAFTATGANLMVQPDVTRVLSITGTKAGGALGGNVTIRGTNIRNEAILEVIALNDNATVPGFSAFKTITEIDLPVVNNAGDTVSIDTTDQLGLDKCLEQSSADPDWGVILQASVAGTTEATLPTIVADATQVELNTVEFDTDLDGTSLFILWFLSTDVADVVQ